MVPTIPINDIDLQQDPQLPGAFPTTNGTSTPTKPLPLLSGTTPGLVDSTQTSRLLRTPGAKLSFASFNPHAASSAYQMPDLNELNLEDPGYRPKRVVVETAESGEQFWRFVPSARKEQGVEGEGKWPRVVEICGKLYECTQDQWDIYKLDPIYNCLVRAYPNLTVISACPPTTPGPSSRTSPQPIPGTAKRARVSSPQPSRDRSSPLPTRFAKRVHMSEPDSDSEPESDHDSESEVEDMIVDGGLPRMPGSNGRSKRKHTKDGIEKGRKERREKMAKRMEKYAAEEVENDDPQSPLTDKAKPTFEKSHSTTPAEEPSGKRKANSLSTSLQSNSQDDQNPFSPISPQAEGIRDTDRPTYFEQNTKRVRKLSPSEAKRQLDAKRIVRERKKQERRRHEVNARRYQRDRQFMQEVFTDIPSSDVEMRSASFIGGDPVSQRNETPQQNPETPKRKPGDDSARLAAILESRRKLAELDRDRPLWEEAAAKRRAMEAAEKRAAAEQAEKDRRMQEELERKRRAEQKAREEREEAERRAREEERQRRERQAERERREREKRQQQQRQSWRYGYWTDQRALERYLSLSQIFDERKFSKTPNDADPITVEDIPWPVLHPPSNLNLEDITWEEVEKFFVACRKKMRSQDYSKLVVESHRRFHPDRWRSRGVLTCIVDDTERGCVEVAANTVAQALTPIWRDVKR